MQSITLETNNYRDSSFVPKYSKSDVDLGNVEKNWEIFFDFEIIAFELVSSNTGFHWQRILGIRCQYVKKQSQDFRHN